MNHGTMYAYRVKACRCPLCVDRYRTYHRNYRRGVRPRPAPGVNVRELLTALKENPCADCGGSFPAECMDFDHLPQYEKRFVISQGKSMPLEELLNEIAKCDLVCANCHRIRTNKRRR